MKEVLTVRVIVFALITAVIACALTTVFMASQDKIIVYTGGVPRTVNMLPGTFITNGQGFPDDPCVSGSLYINSDSGALIHCVASHWVAAIPIVAASFDDTDRKSDLDLIALFSVPMGEGGSYLAKCYETQIATASVYALPRPIFTFMDPDSGMTRTLTAPANPTMQDAVSYAVVLQAMEATDIQISTQDYTSIPGNNMHYAIHCKTTFLGP